MDIVTLGAALNGSKKYTDTVAQSLMGGVRYQGEVDYYADLPSNAEVGDAYTVKYSGTSGTDLDGTEYTWGLNHQTQQYSWIDFSKDSYTKTETNNLLAGKQNVIDSTHKLSADLVDDTNSTNKFVTSAEKTTIRKAVTTDDIGVGTDYFVYNDIRVYVSATEPTGTIPDGSIWLGGVI